jgi:WG containing repeat
MNKKILYLFVMVCQFNFLYAQQNEKKIIDKATYFSNGIALVVEAKKSYYINAEGKYIFDNIYTDLNSVGKTTENDSKELVTINRQIGYTEKLPSKFFVEKNKKYGLMNDSLKYILAPEWDMIDMTYKDYIILKKAKQTTYADTNGNLLLPMLYNDAFVLDHHNKFYAVKLNKWGIYDSENKTMLFDYQFDDFDYCGGCGTKPNYFLAQKNKNWGVVSFDKKILAPFKYQHSHSQMRSDYWEASMSLNNKQVLIDLTTAKQFDASLFEEPGIINSNIFKALNNKGKYFITKRNGDKVPGVFDWLDNDMNFNSFTSFKAAVDGRVGVLDSLGNVLVECIYSDIKIINDFNFAVKNKGKWGIVNNKQRLLVPIVYNEIETDDLGFIFLKKGASYNVFDVLKQVLNNTQFESVDILKFNDSSFFVITELDGKKGILGDSAKLVIPNEYDLIDLIYSTNFFKIKKDNLFGLIDWSGKIIIPCKYDDIDVYNKLNLITAKQNSNYFLYNFNGQKIFESSFSNMSIINDSLFLLKQKNDSLFFIGKRGQQPEQLKYQEVIINGESLSAKINDSAHVLLNFSGKKITNQPYNGIGFLQEGFCAVEKNKKFGFVNATTGKEIVACKYNFVTDFKNGVAKVTLKDSAIEYPYENDSSYVRKIEVNKYTFINTEGKELLPFSYANTYDFAESIIDSFLLLTSLNKVGLANSNGKVLVPSVYQSIFINKNKAGGFIATNKKKYYLYTSTGKLINTIGFDDVLYNVVRNYSTDPTINFEFPLLVKKDGQWIYIKENGAELPFKISNTMQFAGY